MYNFEFIFRVFTTFAITVISESMKSMEKLSGKIVIEKLWNFTHLYLCLKKIKNKKIEKNRKEKEKGKVGSLF